MSTYPMPSCGYTANSGPQGVHNLKTVRLGDNSLYGVVNGVPKDVWNLEHGACTWAEWLAIKDNYAAQVGGGSTTFTWQAGGTAYPISGIWMQHPTVKPGDQYTFIVVSVIGQ